MDGEFPLRCFPVLGKLLLVSLHALTLRPSVARVKSESGGFAEAALGASAPELEVRNRQSGDAPAVVPIPVRRRESFALHLGQHTLWFIGDVQWSKGVQAMVVTYRCLHGSVVFKAFLRVNKGLLNPNA